jgi:hypothetical protein
MQQVITEDVPHVEVKELPMIPDDVYLKAIAAINDGQPNVIQRVTSKYSLTDDMLTMLNSAASRYEENAR